MGLARRMHTKTQGDRAGDIGDLGLGRSPAGKPEKTASRRNPNLSRHSKNRPGASVAAEGINGGEIGAAIRTPVKIGSIGGVKSCRVGPVGRQHGS